MVPAHTGGADLSSSLMTAVPPCSVPAHTGGADLSSSFAAAFSGASTSPPTRAGRI